MDAASGSRVAVWLSEHVLGATFHVECEDEVRVDKSRGYVIVSNHQSSLDAGAIHRLNLSGYIGPTRDTVVFLGRQVHCSQRRSLLYI